MSNITQLTNAIFSVETNNDARLAGIIIERYLLQKLTSKLAHYKYSDIQTGWIIRKLDSCFSIETDGEEEHWYRLITPGSTLSTVDHAVVNTFSQEGRFFFSVEYSSDLIDIPNKKIGLTVSKINLNGEIDRSQSTVPNLQQQLDNYLIKKNLNQTSGLLSKWFHSLDQSELESIFIQRCIMNSMSNCVDIDAITLSETKTLTFLELKRKYPALGVRKFTRSFSPNFPNISKLITNTTPKINFYNNTVLTGSVASTDRTRALSDELDRLLPRSDVQRYQKTRDSYYCGLDWSHYQTLNMCDIAGVTYKYLVWNLDPYGIVTSNKKSSSYEHEILSYLLTPDTKKQRQNSFLYATLNCSSAIGLTFTEGSDSGALTKDIRLQAVFALNPRTVNRNKLYLQPDQHESFT